MFRHGRRHLGLRLRAASFEWLVVALATLLPAVLRANDIVLPSDETPSAAVQPVDDAPRIPPLSAPYVTISLRGVDRSLQVVDCLFQTVLRPDVSKAARQMFQDEGIQLDDSQGLNTHRPLGYLLTLPSGVQFALSGVVPAAEMSEPAAEEVANQEFTVESQAGTVRTIRVDFDENGVEVVEVISMSDTDEPTPAADLESLLEDPAVIMFASITDRQKARQLLDTAMTPTTTLKRVGDRDDLFQAFDADSDTASFALRLDGDEVYLAESDDLLLLEQIAALPTSLNEIAARHDIQASLQLDHLPLRVRQTFSETLWKQSAPGLQQRDDEPAEDFTLRNATERSLIEILDLLITGVEQASISADLIEAEHRFRARLELNAVEGTGLARRLSDLGGPPTLFLPLHDPDAALSLSISIQMTPFEQELFARWVRWLRAAAETSELDSDGDIRAGIGLLCDSLQATVEAGHLDFFVQLEVDGPEHLGVVGGLRLARTSSFRTGLTNIADSVLQSVQESGGGGSEISSEPSHDLLIHHVRAKDELDLENGSHDLDVAVGIGRGALWFAGGALDSRQRLKAALDRMDASQLDPEVPRASPPLLLTMSALQWQKLPLEEDFDARLQRGLAEEAFAKDDHARIELRPTRRGARLEGSFEEGFLRWFALMLATEFDAGEL